MKKPYSVLVVLLALVPALGSAQADRFRAIDRNGDGFVSSDEWYGQGLVAVPFTVVDLNGDSRISEGEFGEWSSARGDAGVIGITTADRFRSVDGNQDGVISAEEWKEGWLSLTPFESVDANKDGVISRPEFRAWDQARLAPPMATPAPLPGTVAPSMSERMRSIERGGAGVSAPVSVAAPAIPASSLRSAPASPMRLPSPSAIPGINSPNMYSGSSLAR